MSPRSRRTHPRARRWLRAPDARRRRLAARRDDAWRRQFFAAGADSDALLAAAALFERVGAELPEARAADAHWNRLKALRIASRTATRDRDRVEALASKVAADFAGRFPGDPRSGALVLERAARESADRQNPELLDALLAIRPDSSSYLSARRQAAAMLFRAAQGVQGDGARAEALRFAEVAGPLLDADTQAALSGDAEAGARAALLSRQLLAVLLADAVSEVALAQRAADRLASLVRAGIVRQPDILAEFRYREIQIALLSGDLSKAESALSALRAIESPDAARYLAGADRLAYRRALALWRQHPDDVAIAHAVVVNGVRVIDQFGADESTLRDGAVLGVYLSVIDASAMIARANGEREMLLLARRLVRRVLASHPGSGLALRRSAELAELAGEHADAVAAWQTLLAGAELGSNDWFEASFQRIRLVSAVNPRDATVLLDRHFELFPTGGPAPWDDRFNALRRTVRREAQRREER